MFAFADSRWTRMLERGHVRPGLVQIHKDGIARKDRWTLPMGRRHDRLNQGAATIFGLDGSLDAERLQADINRTLDWALWFSLGRSGCGLRGA